MQCIARRSPRLSAGAITTLVTTKSNQPIWIRPVSYFLPSEAKWNLKLTFAS